MDSKLSRFCDGLIEAGWLAAIITVPLFFNIHSDRVFEPDKLTLLRSIAVIMLTAWLVKFVEQRGWQQISWLKWRSDNSIWRVPFVLAVVVLAVIYLLSTIFSVTPAISWAGSYQRLQGTYTTLSYMVVFALAVSTIRSQAQMRRLVTAVIITSIPVAFYGLLQHFDLDPLPWAGDTTQRVAGHMGNAIFIAAYLIMVVPLTLTRVIESFTNILGDDEVNGADVLRSSIYIFALAIQLMAIYWSGSRGPWLGLFAGLFAFILVVLVSLRGAAPSGQRFRLLDVGKAVALLLLGMGASFVIVDGLLTAVTNAGQLPSLAGAMTSFVAFVAGVFAVVVAIFIFIAARRGWQWLWLSWILLALLLGGWLITFNLPDEVTAPYADSPLLGSVVTTLNEWRDLPRIGRFGTILEAEGGTGRVRTLIWEGALDLVAPHEPLQFPDGEEDSFNFLRPLLGYGPESMYVAYNRYYPPELATLEARNASPDRSHNETFDAVVITGFGGFIAWQVLYVSVFYFGFQYLGVLRNRRDGILMVGLWVLVGVITAVAFTTWRGVAYIGVAYPFGAIAGLVLYLIYYALFAPPSEESVDPFSTGRLLMVGLLGAVLAHYVEIHFGIAIAATRLHFFIYIALMVVIGYVLPRTQETPEVETTAVSKPSKSSRRSRTRSRSINTGAWGPALLWMLMLGLMTAIIGFTFINFVQPPDITLETAEDLSQITAGVIFQQSMFVNPKADFADSPFVFLMITLSWALGVLLAGSEMVKSGTLSFNGRSDLPANRRTIAALVFGVMAIIALAWRFLVPNAGGPTAQLGGSLLLMWAVLCLWAAIRLYFEMGAALLVAAMVALTGLVFSLPVLVAGSAIGLGLAVACSVVLYLLWQPDWNDSLLPLLTLALGSITIGFIYTYLQASLLRFSITFRPSTAIETIEQLLDFRVREASMAGSYLTALYIFLALLLVVAGYMLAYGRMRQTRSGGSGAGYGALLGLIIVSAIIVSTTNMRVVQADMLFKRGKPFEQQGTVNSDPQSWDVAIAIYERVVEMTPREDFYYLFLGRAYLERSTLAQDEAEQRLLLNEAQERLLRAQDINPLNTDHTANLARLNTRWVGLAQNDTERSTRIDQAASFYEDALALSPQNSIIRNEYARLAFDLERDCDKALAIFDEAVTIDPYFSTLYFNQADVMVGCAAAAPVEEQTDYYKQAISSLEAGLEQGSGLTRAWLQLAQLQQEVDDFDAAADSFEQVRVANLTDTQFADWNIDFLEARLYADAGDTDTAVALAQSALATAPPEAAGQIQTFIQSLTGEVGAIPSPNTGLEALTGERPLAQLPPVQRNGIYPDYPEFVIDPAQTYEAIIVTDKGDIRVRLFPEVAPLAVNSFVYLANQGFYDSTTFHRVLPEFMAQGGDPTGTGGGGPGYEFANETSPDLGFDRSGLLAMANAGPDTNGSQFFITKVPTPWLDGGYTIFGEVIDGLNVVDSLTLRDPDAAPDFTGDVIQRIDILAGGE